jgi:hypothetical protein
LNIAKETGRPFNELLQYFAMERFLFRLSRSTHAKSFVLKGALLFRVWDTPDSGATRDVDFLAYVDNSLEIIANINRDICATADPNDGLHGFTFTLKSPIGETGVRCEGNTVVLILLNYSRFPLQNSSEQLCLRLSHKNI